MSVKLWDLAAPARNMLPLMQCWDHHTEFDLNAADSHHVFSSTGPAQRYFKAMYHVVAKQMPPGSVADDTKKAVRRNWRALSTEGRQEYCDATDRDKAHRLLEMNTVVSLAFEFCQLSWPARS